MAIGDLHGDLAATRAALRLAGAIDAQDRWAGGTMTLVQLGDEIDRGDEDREVLALLERLRGEAQAAGGSCVLLNGNHELMNVAGDLRYVSEAGAAAYGGMAGRQAAFAPGSELARLFAGRAVYAIIGDSLFVHGGVLPPHLDVGLEALDAEARAWMRGEQKAMPRVMTDEDSPLWTRRYGGEADSVDCQAAQVVLARLKLKRMVVAHTTQARGIGAACEGTVWRVDVGLARMYGGPIQVLEIVGGDVKVLSAERPE